jgi:hypothetical protein
VSDLVECEVEVWLISGCPRSVVDGNSSVGC